MIESGSNVPGVDWTSLGIPAGTAIRYERPAEALRPYFPSYAVLDSDPTIFTGPHSWLLPGSAQMWIVLTDAPITAKVRRRIYAPLGQAVLYGPTRQAMPVTSNGGVSIVIDISAAGWARWLRTPAEEYRDRITPLAELMPTVKIDELIARLHASDRCTEVKVILEAFFLNNMPAPASQEPLISRTAMLLADPVFIAIPQIANELGVSSQTLLRIVDAILVSGRSCSRAAVGSSEH